MENRGEKLGSKRKALEAAVKTLGEGLSDLSNPLIHGKSRQHYSKSTWRLTAITAFIVWTANFVLYAVQEYKHSSTHVLPLELMLAFHGATILVALIIIFLPLKFWFHAVMCYIWGCLRIIDGMSTLGMLGCIMGVLFVYSLGMFRQHKKIKIIIITLMPACATVISILARREIWTRVLISYLDFSFLAILFILFFRTERYQSLAVQHGTSLVLPCECSDTDRDILQRILNGEKYLSIFTDHNISESTFKHQVMPKLFHLIGVADRRAFMTRYSGSIVSIETT
jgi:hypothetical protein